MLKTGFIPLKEVNKVVLPKPRPVNCKVSIRRFLDPLGFEEVSSYTAPYILGTRIQTTPSAKRDSYIDYVRSVYGIPAEPWFEWETNLYKQACRRFLKNCGLYNNFLK